jgi:hypothetical protein
MVVMLYKVVAAFLGDQERFVVIKLDFKSYVDQARLCVEILVTS